MGVYLGHFIFYCLIFADLFSISNLRMSPSTISTKFRTPSNGNLCKLLAISGLILYVLSTVLTNHPHCQPYKFSALSSYKQASSNLLTDSPTNISHLVFAIAGTVNSWKARKSYIEAWWKPNMTRGYIFLDRALPEEFLPWPPSSPPFRVSEDITKLKVYPKHVSPMIIRIVRMVLETFREGDEGVRWYIMGDDDTIFFNDNLVEVLAKYDHTKYFYIGANSESVKSNIDFSFDMAYGGAGVALSYPLVAALAGTLDECIERYWYFYVSDRVLHSCLADLGVALTQEKGFHQIDLRHDISGFLSAHPQSPFLSLHHLNLVAPIFPSLNRHESVNHLMKAAKVDQSRLLQQIICHNKQSNWTFSISWGYTTHLYESIFPQSFLRRPLETFWPWKKNTRYMFNTRFLSNDPCEAPHSFFFDSIESASGNQIVTTYIRASERGLPACSSSGNYSADFITKIQVFSPAIMRGKIGSRKECCDIIRLTDNNVTEIKFRACMKDELIA